MKDPNLKFIHDKIMSNSRINKSFKSELIDHYYTHYEDLIQHNTENEALNIIIRSIENESIHFPKKSHRMQLALKMVLICSLICSSLIFYKLSNNSPIQPPYELLSEKINLHEDPPFGNPLLDFQVSSNFGERRNPFTKKIQFHKGIDLIAPLGTNVITVENGIITQCGYDKSHGYFIEIKHDEIYITRYHHLQSIFVEQNETVSKNQIIGKVGSTGKSTAPHLHYEIIKKGEWVDAKDYIKA